MTIPEYRTAQYEHHGRTHAVIDRRTGDGVPFLHRGAWYDSYAAAEQFDYQVYGTPTTAIRDAQAADEQARRVAQRKAMVDGPDYVV